MLEDESLVSREAIATKDVANAAKLKRRPTFAIVCGLLGLVAFIQLVMVGVAVANRVGETRVVEVTELGETRVVYIPTIADALPNVEKQKVRSYDDILKSYGNADENGKADDGVYKLASDFSTPKPQFKKRTAGSSIRPQPLADNGRFIPIKNSRVEKLVEEAKLLHLSGDVVRAVLKLEEAEIIDPAEPAIIYRRALIFEDMRNWERAGDEYDKLFALGPEVGDYYDIATDKIANGVKDAPDVVPFQLGNVVQRMSQNKLEARVTIPVRRLTKREIESSQIDVRIFFYDIVDNKVVEPVPQQREENIVKRWITQPTDWSRSAEEVAEAVYTLPELGLADVHLFGERRYFGHVVELYYKGELMDQVAFPGRLHGIHAEEQYRQHVDPEMMYFDTLPDLEGLDSDGMLLPKLKE